MTKSRSCRMSTASPRLVPNWIWDSIRLGWVLTILPLVLVAGCAITVDQPASGLRGIILSGPTCPVVGPDTGDECDDQPYAGTVIVQTVDGSLELTRFSANASGVFEIALNPGMYLLVPQPGENGFPLAEEQVVQVHPDAFTDVTILYDTGIR